MKRPALLQFSLAYRVQAQEFLEGLTEGAYFDEDTQGFRRIVAHGDEWMHSRLIHDGVEQRVRVDVSGLAVGTKWCFS